MVEQIKTFISGLDGEFKTNECVLDELVMLGFVPQPNLQNQFFTYD